MTLKRRVLSIFLYGIFIINFAALSPATASEVVVCNKSNTELWLASFWKEGGLSCGFSGQGCSIHSAGWWPIEPGDCVESTSGMFFESYMVLTFDDSNGKRQSAQFPENSRVLSGQKFRGSSGVKELDVCIKWEVFSRKVQGNWSAVFSESCPSGYEKFPVSLYGRASDEGREIVNVR